MALEQRQGLLEHVPGAIVEGDHDAGRPALAREQVAAAQEGEAPRQLRELSVEALGALVGAQAEAPRIRRADEVVVDRDGARRCRTHGV